MVRELKRSVAAQAARLCLGCLALGAVIAFSAISARAQTEASIDQNVWKMLYGVTDAQLSNPNWFLADDDGDGISNGAELAAGTNPFNAGSTLAITSTVMNPDGTVTVNFPTAAGKLYVLQASTDMSSSANWSTIQPLVQTTGTGAAASLIAPAPGSTSTFYRILVQDVDSDSDGVSNWAELATGYDPNATHTHGSSVDDFTSLTTDLVQENVVTVSATKATATQPADSVTPATDFATITVTRGGSLHFSAITVPLSWSGTAQSGIDYAALPTTVTFPVKVSSVTLTVMPVFNANLKTGVTVTAKAMPGGGYSVGGASSASAVISPAGNALGTGLTGSYYNSTSGAIGAGYSASLFNGTPTLVRIDPTVDYTWATGNPGVSPGGTVHGTYFVAQWQGQVQPQYSETYYFDVVADDGVKLWVNGQLILDSWKYVSGDRLGSISLKGGVLYDITLQYYQAASADQIHLSWYSNSQSKQVIPSNRLYPTTPGIAPPAIVSAQSALGFVNQPFSYTVQASLSGGVGATFALGAGSGPLPPGLSLNPATGVISGTPTTAGDYQIAITATNANGTGGSVLDIQILANGSGITRELWSGLPGTNVSDIPLSTTPASIDTNLANLADYTAYSNNTGERLRGYFVAPATGNYFFWLSASNNAELWVSDDTQTVNLVRRAWVTSPGTAVDSWNDPNQTHQQSAWISLVAGQSYYYEVLHNVGAAGSSSNLSVAYLMDSLGTATTPGSNPVAPAYLLTQYNYPTSTAATGTLYTTNLSPQGASVSSATGSANLRMLPGNSQAILHFSYSGLSSPRTAYHLHIAPDQTGSGPIVFDLDDVDKFHPELKTTDGGYIWNIVDSGAYTAAQIVSAVQNGTIYFNVHTVNFPAGEIRGFLTLVNGSQYPPTYVPDPGFTDDSATDAGAARFLNQAAFGAAPADVTAVESSGYAAWINSQMSLPATHFLSNVQAAVTAQVNTNANPTPFDNTWWQSVVNNPDQLRQRVAFALSQILVISDSNAAIANNVAGMASYYDMLADNAFGNFRSLLKAATLHPAMGYWLNMQGNALGNLATGYHPNENYAREIMQLFSVGLNRLWPDGSSVLDSSGNLVPTYNQGVITNGFARVFTGWTWNQSLQASGQLPTNFYPAQDWIDPMVMVKNYHELGTKTLLDNVVLPAAVGYNPVGSPVAGSQADPTSTAYDTYCQGNLDQGLDNIFNHPNVGPYVCRQLIQRLVESNPTPAYVYRVVQVFNDDGTASHVRGNLTAVIKAVLLDGEARNASAAMASTSAGKQREPLLRITGPARTFPFTANSGSYSQAGTAVTTITTTNPNHFSGGDPVWLDFSGNDTGNPPVAPANNPTTGAYSVLSNPAPTSSSFSVNAASLASVNCSEAANTNTLTVSTAGPLPGEPVYLMFMTGGFANGIYTVTANPTSSSFTVTVGGAAPSINVSGTVLVPKLSGYDNIKRTTGTTPNTITIATQSNSNINSGDSVWVAAGSVNQLKDAQWTVDQVIDERHFTIVNTTVYTKSESNIGVTIYPLTAPVLNRSGVVAMPAGRYDMGNTNGQIVQTPLDSPTVFNFYYPNYQYPGTLAANNVTVPEFQLTTDSNILTVTNTVASTILASGNANGLSNFKNGAINLDLSAYMGSPYFSFNTVPVTKGNTVTATTTTSVNATLLINKLGDILTGGALTSASKAKITTFITNATYFPVTQTATGTVANPPPAPTLPTTSARDQTRAVVHAILTSSEYAIQK